MTTNQSFLHTIIGGNSDDLRGGSSHLIELHDTGRTKASILVDAGCAWTNGCDGKTKFSVADTTQDIAAVDAIILTHPHNDHISGLPKLVAEMRRQDLPMPPIYLNRFTLHALRAEFAHQSIGTEGLDMRLIRAERPFYVGSDQKFKLTAYHNSHIMPTLGLIVQTLDNHPLTMVLESDVKSDPTVLLHPGISTDRLKALCGGPIHNLATSVYDTAKKGGHTMQDASIQANLHQAAKDHRHVVFATFGGYTDIVAITAAVAAAHDRRALVYQGRTTGLYLDALQAAGYDIASAVAGQNPNFAVLPQARAKHLAAGDVFYLSDIDHGDVQAVVEGKSLPVPLGPDTLFAFIPGCRDQKLIAAIAATGSHIYNEPNIDSHDERFNALQRIADLAPRSVTMLHAGPTTQKAFSDWIMGERGLSLPVIYSGDQREITHQACQPSAVGRMFATLDIPDVALVTRFQPPVPKPAPILREARAAQNDMAVLADL